MQSRRSLIDGIRFVVLLKLSDQARPPGELACVLPLCFTRLRERAD
jgi:hypothetical protein